MIITIINPQHERWSIDGIDGMTSRALNRHILSTVGAKNAAIVRKAMASIEDAIKTIPKGKAAIRMHHGWTVIVSNP